MSDPKNYTTPSRSATNSVEKPSDKVDTGEKSRKEAQAWSKKTKLPIHLWTRSKEFEKKYGDMSRVDKYGRPTHTKSGDRILRFR